MTALQVLQGLPQKSLFESRAQGRPPVPNLFHLPAKRKPILDLRAAFSRGLEIHKAANPLKCSSCCSNLFNFRPQ